jgi:hypothetical protein
LAISKNCPWFSTAMSQIVLLRYMAASRIHDTSLIIIFPGVYNAARVKIRSYTAASKIPPLYSEG